MKQEERRQQTTRRLIDATKALIEEKGCYSITMQDIMTDPACPKGRYSIMSKAKTKSLFGFCKKFSKKPIDVS